MSFSDKCFELQCETKNYAWGKVGMESMVALLQKSRNPNFLVKDNETYAELWMGTHTSGPSVIPSKNNMMLSDWIKKHPNCIGKAIRNKFGVNFPFLFKVLSVNQALSIQVHPDKQKAEELYKRSPDLYADDNHKPEMAIALTRFQALCGFRPLVEIQAFFKDSPQLQSAVGEAFANKLLSESKTSSLNDEYCSAILKSCFEALMRAPEKLYKQNLKDLISELKSGNIPESFKPISQLFLELNSKYPDDIGCFVVFFLNYLILEPGEAIYLSANVPHAYLVGDCIECMACSDNVVRAGLTPKYKDVETLCSILAYECKTAEENFFYPIKQPGDNYIDIYDPPIDEFAVAKIEIPKGEVYKLKALDSASILLLVHGEISASIPNDKSNIKLSTGAVFFISCETELNIEVISNVLMFRAYCS